MQKERIVCAPTVERAIDKALAELALDRDAVSVEVLDMGRKGFLGIGATDAKIKVTYEAPEPPVQAVPDVRPQPVETEPAVQKPVRPRDEAPRLVKAAEKPADKMADSVTAAPAQPKQDDTPRLVKAADKANHVSDLADVADRADLAGDAQPVDTPVRPAPAMPLPESEWAPEAKAAAAFIDGLLVKLGVEGCARVVDTTTPDHVRIDIQGPDMGPVIGRRGDTLDAIQYLTSLVLNRTTESHVRLTIDTENYRVKRAESLERLAHKMAGKVLRYHKAMTLEPMNPYERRIIHSALQEVRGVTTHSTGTEPNRRVVISPEGGKRFSGRGGRRDYRR